VPANISIRPLSYYSQTAKAHAIEGALFGAALGVINSIISVRQSQLEDRYDVVTEALTHVGTGAALGALAATTAGLAGVSVAGIAGRGILGIVVPLVASSVATGSAHRPVERLVRSWSEDVVSGLKRTLERQASSDGT